MPPRSKKRIVLNGIALLLVSVLVYQWWTGSPPSAPVTRVTVGGSYDTLTLAQRRLVDDWVARYGTVTGKTASAAGMYDSLALSTKTTFNAVTHALSFTQLTDAAGQPMNLTALDLIAKIDAVAGNIPGQSGDRQFRMYVQLRPDTQQLLERSREFDRQVDNTVYHKGYPICFRGSGGGTPSIQFSLARDGTHGDIDVDYRSSAFPIMLINGHLTASNSDVRAGNNDERHNGRWSGLTNWWRGFMGLPLADSPTGAAGDNAVSSEPRLGKGTKAEDAVFDFLHAWLVEQVPRVAVGYIAPRAFACLEVERGAPVDRGVARFQMVAAMQAINQQIGKVRSPAEVLRGVTLTGARSKEIPQPHRDAFVMYEIREDLAESLDCENKLRPEQSNAVKAQSTKSGDYVGAVFQLKAGSLTGEAVATVWARENGAWMLVAYDVEPEFRAGALPAVPPATESAEPARAMVAGDPAMQRAAEDFLRAWFVRKDLSAASRHLAPASVTCYNVYRPDSAPQAGSPADARRLVQEQMKLLGDFAGGASRLEDIFIAVEPHHPDLKLVSHDAAATYSIVAMPDSMGTALDCAQLKSGEPPTLDREGPQTYGRFYAVSLRLKRAGEEAAVLWLVWAKEGPDWKVVSYLPVTP